MYGLLNFQAAAGSWHTVPSGLRPRVLKLVPLQVHDASLCICKFTPSVTFVQLRIKLAS